MCKPATYTVERADGAVLRNGRKAPQVFLAFAPSAAPAIDLLPQTEWICKDKKCTVREVVISENVVRAGERIGEPRCPGCGGRLAFSTYLHTTSLVKVGEGDEALLPSVALA